MKTAVSIPDPLFRDADRLARKLRKSRSQVYAEAVAEYLARHDDDAVAQAMNTVVDAFGSAPDPFVARAARRVLEQVEW